MSVDFAQLFDVMANEAFIASVAKGFYETPVEDGTRIALIHSELSEALEGLRQGNPPDDKIPEFSSAEAELADAVIRILDIAGYRHWRVGAAIEAKMAYNLTRPYRHGGKAF